MFVTYLLIAILFAFFLILLLYKMIITFTFSTIFLILLFLYSGFFIVRESEQVVVTQFSNIIGKPYKKPGLYFKIPFIWKTHYFDKRIQSDSSFAAKTTTKDGFLISVDSVYFWFISHPEKYMISTISEKNMFKKIIRNLTSGTIRENVASHNLIELIRNKKIDKEEMPTSFPKSTANRKALGLDSNVNLGRSKLEEKIINTISSYVLERFGVTLLNVLIKKVTYDPSVKNFIYERMKSDKLRYAAELRSEGRSEARKIQGKGMVEYQKIIAPAKREALLIQGQAKSKEIELKSTQYNKDLDFYKFWRSLNSYKENLAKKSTNMILSTKSEFFQYFKQKEKKQIKDKAEKKQIKDKAEKKDQVKP